MSVQTPYGFFVKWVSQLDEARQLVTVIGHQGQVCRYAISAMIVTEGIEELRREHQKYVDHLDTVATVAKQQLVKPPGGK